jgi:hypothetical protein
MQTIEKTILVMVAALAISARADLMVTMEPVKVTGQKAVVKLEMKNTFAEEVQSARAVVFLLDAHGKVIGQSTRWVIGGTRYLPGLPPGATNNYSFVITSPKPFAATNLTAKVQFSRVVLESGKLANVTQDVKMNNASNK